MEPEVRHDQEPCMAGFPNDVPAAASDAHRAALSVIEAVDPVISGAIRGQLANQRSQLKLIASENYASMATLLAMGNWFSDKYAEGTIGHRFYAGCEVVDVVEARAVEHARELFGAAHAYVQPHSGIDANLVAYWAVLAQRVERRHRLEPACTDARYPMNDDHQTGDVPLKDARHREPERPSDSSQRCRARS